jgi:hypothetical protein
MLSLLNAFEEIFYKDKPEYKEMAFQFDSVLFNMDKINHCGTISALCQVVGTCK